MFFEHLIFSNRIPEHVPANSGPQFERKFFKKTVRDSSIKAFEYKMVPNPIKGSSNGTTMPASLGYGTNSPSIRKNKIFKATHQTPILFI